MPTDLDQLSREFKRIAPEDTALIDQLVRAARRCASLEPPLEKPLELMTPFEKMRLGLRYLPMLPVILKWKRLPHHHLSGALPERFPARNVADARQRRAHVGPGAGDGAGVQIPQEHRLCRRRLAGVC